MGSRVQEALVAEIRRIQREEDQRRRERQRQETEWQRTYNPLFISGGEVPRRGSESRPSPGAAPGIHWSIRRLVAPQTLVGVGTIAVGFDASGYYRPLGGELPRPG